MERCSVARLEGVGGTDMARSKGTAGVIGLGIMGGAYARNLKGAGWRVIGFDTSAARRRELARAGVEIVDGAAAVARATPVIITSLPAPSALHATVRDIIASGAPRRTVVEAGTFSLDDKLAAGTALRKAGHIALDCPVSGTGAQAKVKDLVVYASGDSKAIAKLRPLFAAYSRQLHDLGDYGNGSRMKYVANLLVAIHNVASAEALVLGMKAGLDPKRVFELATAGAGNSRVLELRGPMMVKNRYADATMKISTWQKDMSVIGAFAASLGCPTPLLSATLPIYAAAMSTGHAAHDTAAVCAVLEQMAGFDRVKGRRKRSRA
jgi:3-hydroxyisobutyrate dehydrogenase-like beta-hydroxyacid dehydrogenase